MCNYWNNFCVKNHFYYCIFQCTRRSFIHAPKFNTIFLENFTNLQNSRHSHLNLFLLFIIIVFIQKLILASNSDITDTTLRKKIKGSLFTHFRSKCPNPHAYLYDFRLFQRTLWHQLMNTHPSSVSTLLSCSL